jgi:hypothetical protein
VAPKEAEALVDGRHGRDRGRCNNQPDDINERGCWQQKQQHLRSYAKINKKERVKDALVISAGGDDVTAHLVVPAPQWWG